MKASTTLCLVFIALFVSLDLAQAKKPTAAAGKGHKNQKSQGKEPKVNAKEKKVKTESVSESAEVVQEPKIAEPKYSKAKLRAVPAKEPKLPKEKKLKAPKVESEPESVDVEEEEPKPKYSKTKVVVETSAEEELPAKEQEKRSKRDAKEMEKLVAAAVAKEMEKREAELVAAAAARHEEEPMKPVTETVAEEADAGLSCACSKRHPKPVRAPKPLKMKKCLDIAFDGTQEPAEEGVEARPVPVLQRCSCSCRPHEPTAAAAEESKEENLDLASAVIDAAADKVVEEVHAQPSDINSVDDI